MIDDKPNTYLDALKSKPLRNVKVEPNERVKAIKEQKGLCAKCHKEINRAFAKFIENPNTKKYTVLCHHCAIESNLFKRK